MPTLEFLSEFIHKCEGKIFLAHLYKYKLNNHIEYLDNIIEKKLIDGNLNINKKVLANWHIKSIFQF